ncbi:MAG: 3-phosphoshikimate 1-carboxyvinyltransferase [Chloroflexota bacterium]
MIATVRSSARLDGQLRVPGDKSISHRAAILNALAEGAARVENFLPGADCLSTLNCLSALGVGIEVLAGGPESRRMSLVVHGVEALQEPAGVLDAGNSGTTMRLLSGLLAGQPNFAVLTGDDSLRSRPMGRIVDPLRRMGAQIWGRRDGTLAPLAIRGGSLSGLTYDLPVASAQLKSALLLAGIQADGQTQLREPARSRDHTERMLAAMGAPIQVDGRTITITGPARLRPRDVVVPGDISSAAFWLVAAAAHPRAEVTVLGVGCNPTRAGIIEALEAMGAEIKMENQREEAGEPVADITVRSSELRGIELGGEIIPRLIDEIPVLAVAAAFATGRTVVRDAGELRVKETDRVATVANELRGLGVRIEERADGFVVEGGRALHGARCRSRGDHRLAMALAVAGLLADGETVIEDAEAVEVSYPGFWEDLAALSQG